MTRVLGGAFVAAACLPPALCLFVMVADTREEQSATTAEIGRTLSGSVRTTSQIATAIGTVASAASEATACADLASTAAAALQDTARQLQGLVQRFRID